MSARAIVDDDSADLFGKNASDLQSDIVISGNTITGSLKYVDDYSSAFGGDLSSGNYIALHFEYPNEEASIVVTLTNPVTLDEDGNVVLRIADKDTQTITVVAYVDNEAVDTQVYDISGLEVADGQE